MVVYRGEKFSGYNKPKRTPKHPKKSHAVLAKKGDKIKLIRFKFSKSKSKNHDFETKLTEIRPPCSIFSIFKKMFIDKSLSEY